MAKYLGIPLTVSNGNRTPLTAQPELVANGDFSDGTTDWSGQNATIAVVGGELEVTSTSGFGKAVQSTTTVVGKSYTLSAKVTAGTTIARLELFSSPSLLQSGSIGETVSSGSQQISLSFVATATTTEVQLKCQSASLGTAYFDNVSVKEIAATETPTYGSPQLVPNSDFTSNSDWTFDPTDGTISISGGELIFSSAITNSFAKTSTNIIEIGKRYVVKVDIASLTGDNPRIRLTAGGDTSVFTPYYTSAGVYTHTFTPTASTTNGKLQVHFYTDTTGGATVNSVTLYEVPYVESSNLVTSPYTQSFNLEENWSAANSLLNFIGDNSSPRYATSNSKINLEFGKTYRVKFDILNKTLGGTTNAGISNTGYFSAVPSSQRVTTSTGNTSFDFIAVLEDVAGKTEGIAFVGQSTDTFTIANFSVTEVQYDYLQVTDGGFKKSVKEGDVIFNTSTSTEGVVKQVLDNNVLLMSNDNFSTAGEFFNVFAANGDTRGNQVVRTDNYIMSEYDENASNPQETSFWFAGGVNADKVALTQLNPATNTFFVAGVIEEYLERLNAQSATASRLDIPLDAFRDHKYNEVLTTTAITLS